jgi:hypothetical protein
MLALVFSLFACQSITVSKGQPAILVDVSEQGLVSLQAVLATALQQDSVNISKTIFSERSIESFSLLDLTGRSIHSPRTFQLLKSGARCYLEDQQHNRRYKLKQVQCVVNAAAQ